MKKLATLIALGAASLVAQGAVTEFSYNPDPASPDYSGYGFSKRETYDVAIRLSDPTLVGGKITGIRVAIPAEDAWIADISAWLSSELKLENKVNVPDIASVPAVMADRTITASFAEPYTIPAEGVYVGYSFTVTELGDYSTRPLACVQGDSPESFYIHTSRTRLRWTDEHADSGFVSALVVTVQTESGDTDVAVSLPDETIAVKGQTGITTLSLVNYGTQPLTDVGYTWSAGEVSGRGSLALPSPLLPGDRTTADVEIGPFPVQGLLTLDVTAETFNTQPNGDPRRSASGKLVVMPFMPVNRPLVEEYTGLRCGYCPQGYVAMEQMSEELGDMFVGLAYHTETYESGAMVVMSDSDFPVDVPGFPYCTLNRGNGVEFADLSADWHKEAATVAPADIDVSLEWSGSDRPALHAVVTLDFAREYDDADMSLAIAIVADGLKKESWRQHNYFADSTDYSGPLWDLFTKGGSNVSGLTFNHVVARFDNLDGVAGSVPSVITFETHPQYAIELPLDQIVNNKGEVFLTPGSTLHAVGVLIDNATGRVLNSNKSQSLLFDDSAVESVALDSMVVETIWTDMQGRRVADPASGLMLIKTERLADGTLRHAKVMNR